MTRRREALQYPPMVRRLKASRRPALAAVALLALAAALPGCAPPQSKSLDEALVEYDNHQYNTALVKAKTAMRNTSGADEDRARFVAGMSAYRLDKTAEALSLLNPLKFNGNDEIGGPTNATLGLIYKERGENILAESCLLRATTKLNGNDAAQAHYHLASVYQKLGRWEDAQKHLQLCTTMATSPSLRLAAQQQLDSSGFTLQLGAYSNETNANDRARDLREKCERLGIGTPRVMPSKAPNGATLYLVQVGKYVSFNIAMTARTRLGDKDVAVTTIKTDN
ncbi:MAG: hypothetical protein GC159_11860 [Phycisphaera sp.]|nr:hypothetical protein [Phycisphaera sp.]